MEWAVEYTDDFEGWWIGLSESEQEDVNAGVILIERFGPTLRFPHSSGIAASSFPEMRELRVQHAGRPYRVLYAFDPHRSAILLIGGDKTGDNRWYETYVPQADRIFRQHLSELKNELKN
ncbi:MAG: type II toxin-antitoxin system RelE/ParE family toxin [Acidobacteriota bacterium]|nr:type II toxin-antitoxin system RelE/ParE family toxin [Acidobacteriota bacterium]